ncbi:mitochondrial translocase subunit [Angomonas deanei]|nr:mitochondrial translocase subunit [Angomonas deanei]|eukprot:EPY43759.1 mitochondrial translocase subunit [Angomonas deanei]
MLGIYSAMKWEDLYLSPIRYFHSLLLHRKRNKKRIYIMFRKKTQEEFDVLQTMQEDRMAYSASLACHERCVNNYWLNHLYLWERSCMTNCLEKLNQVTVVTNINYGKFEEDGGKMK